MSRLFARYNTFVTSRPVLAPMLVSFTLFGAGDVIAQQLVEKKGKQHDLVRTARLATYGGFIFAPLVLEKIPLRTKTAQVAGRVALDQFVFTPVVLSVFFTATTLMEGRSLADAQKKLETSYKPTLLANWTLFIPFQTFNMATVNVISLFWNTYLSLAASNPHPARLA
ncbi:hypothetical protein DL93DRAFT_2070069 [Clavulina sp. PMI_390]|nr:hypothetical protein DL93DRAFT_2070069 [Clavulina sp. PMI_390]